MDAQGYVFYRVQGWQENGKWQRRRFKDRTKAETFAAALRVQMENAGRAQRMVLSPLTDEQHEEALPAGNSEGIVKRHYLNTHTQDEGGTFFRIIPDLAARKAVLAAQSAPVTKKHLRAV